MRFTLIIFKQRFVERSKCNTNINTLNVRYKSRCGEDASRRLVLLWKELISWKPLVLLRFAIKWAVQNLANALPLTSRTLDLRSTADTQRADRHSRDWNKWLHCHSTDAFAGFLLSRFFHLYRSYLKAVSICRPSQYWWLA